MASGFPFVDICLFWYCDKVTVQAKFHSIFTSTRFSKWETCGKKSFSVSLVNVDPLQYQVEFPYMRSCAPAVLLHRKFIFFSQSLRAHTSEMILVIFLTCLGRNISPVGQKGQKVKYPDPCLPGWLWIAFVGSGSEPFRIYCRVYCLCIELPWSNWTKLRRGMMSALTCTCGHASLAMTSWKCSDFSDSYSKVPTGLLSLFASTERTAQGSINQKGLCDLAELSPSKYRRTVWSYENTAF